MDPKLNKKQAEEKFKEINEAYEVLGDPPKRKKYDELGANWNAGADFRPPDGRGCIDAIDSYSRLAVPPADL